MIIAIDGPAAAGKGTLGRRLAEHFGLAYLDTGLIYRAIASKMLQRDLDPADPEAAAAVARTLSAEDLEDPALRGDEAAQAASQVAAIADVRAAVLDFQRAFAAHPPGGARGAVLDGRDIGTVVCPEADHKLFVTADLEARATRRLQELRERGVESIYARVLQDMAERDARDSQREVAPLVPAVDAFMLDTTEMEADAAFAAALKFITSRCAAGGG
ncbi:MAG: (d)CMP kinase [Alphaproteobacteria bacterium]